MKSTWRKTMFWICSPHRTDVQDLDLSEEGGVRHEAVDAGPDVDVPGGAPLEDAPGHEQVLVEVRPARAGARRPVVEHRHASGGGEIRWRRPALLAPVRPVVAQVHWQCARGVEEAQELDAREDQDLVEPPRP
jgi:hypothetical protein